MICRKKDLTTPLIGGNNKAFKNLVVFLNVAALIMLFLIRLRFPHCGSGDQEKMWTEQLRSLQH